MKKPKVLFVDDELITLKSFEIYFGSDFQVFTAMDGSKALTLLEEHKDMSVLITDYKMPKINGMQLIKNAKLILPGIVCLLVTGYNNTPEILLAMSENLIAETFTKPINLQYLETRISTILS